MNKPGWVQHESFFRKGPEHRYRRQFWIVDSPGYEHPLRVCPSTRQEMAVLTQVVRNGA